MYRRVLLRHNRLLALWHAIDLNLFVEGLRVKDLLAGPPAK